MELELEIEQFVWYARYKIILDIEKFIYFGSIFLCWFGFVTHKYIACFHFHIFRFVLFCFVLFCPFRLAHAINGTLWVLLVFRIFITGITAHRKSEITTKAHGTRCDVIKIWSFILQLAVEKLQNCFITFYFHLFSFILVGLTLIFPICEIGNGKMKKNRQTRLTTNAYRISHIAHRQSQIVHRFRI